MLEMEAFWYSSREFPCKYKGHMTDKQPAELMKSET